MFNIVKCLYSGFDVGESDDVEVKATVKIHNGIHLQNVEINSERDDRVREFLKNIDGKEIFKESNDRARDFFQRY